MRNLSIQNAEWIQVYIFPGDFEQVIASSRPQFLHLYNGWAGLDEPLEWVLKISFSALIFNVRILGWVLYQPLEPWGRVFKKQLLGVDHLWIPNSPEAVHCLHYSWCFSAILQSEPGSSMGSGISPFVCSWIRTKQWPGQPHRSLKIICNTLSKDGLASASRLQWALPP